MWNIQSQMLLQSCSALQDKEFHVPNAMYYHTTTATLFVGSNKVSEHQIGKCHFDGHCDVVSMVVTIFVGITTLGTVIVGAN